MKTIKFLGEYWEVPSWASYITQNGDNGAICVWERPPVKNGTCWYCADWTNPGESKCIGHVPIAENIMRV